MRIIAGEHRGRRLEAPKGQTTRPTTDRVRESMMSAIASMRGGFDGAVVLDVFAGSGALSLEAMSRGAAYACLCECDPGALKVIERNVRTLGYDRSQVRVVRTDVLKSMPPRARGAYDLVMLDPPYALPSDAVFALIGRLSSAGLLADDAVVTYEHDEADNADVDEQISASPFSLSSRKRYGSTVIDYLAVSKEHE